MNDAALQALGAIDAALAAHGVARRELLARASRAVVEHGATFVRCLPAELATILHEGASDAAELRAVRLARIIAGLADLADAGDVEGLTQVYRACVDAGIPTIDAVEGVAPCIATMRYAAQATCEFLSDGSLEPMERLVSTLCAAANRQYLACRNVLVCAAFVLTGPRLVEGAAALREIIQAQRVSDELQAQAGAQ